ncbi:MAG: isocitrate/isopropylmalate family dehydrogenase [Thermomicrobiales bacterium]
MHLGVGEFMPTPDMALSIGLFTRQASERIAHAACRLAQQRRRYVTVVHKANVIRLGTGLFRDVCREVAAAYPDVRVDDEHVDAMAAHLVRRAPDFDVIVTENLFGDILSDLAAELTGSLGLAPSLNAGADHAMAQAAPGSAPALAGQDLANPVGEMLSAALLLRWLGDRHGDEGLISAGGAIETAVARTLADGVRTRDLGGDVGTMTLSHTLVTYL